MGILRVDGVYNSLQGAKEKEEEELQILKIKIN